MTTNSRLVAVLNAVNNHWMQHRIPPTRREIADATGINSTSMVSEYLRQLKENGVLRMDDKKARSVVPCWVDDAFDLYKEAQWRE